MVVFTLAEEENEIKKKEDADEEPGEEALQDNFLKLCVSCGFNPETVDTESIDEIEVVLDDFAIMTPVIYFTNLIRLTLVSQDIKKIDGLQKCTQLEYLCLNENDISKIECLDACTNLQKLHLSFNSISSVSNLKNLTRLEVFWVAHNQISSISTSHLPLSLRDLNLAANKISRLDEIFNMPRLEVLSLAGNDLSDVRDILSNLQLPKLQEINFHDDDWGSNPIMNILNYRTFFLYHLPRTLRVFDRTRLSPSVWDEVVFTFEKKRLFFNMRIKSMRHLAMESQRAIVSFKEERRLNLFTYYQEVRMHGKAMCAYRACKPFEPDESNEQRKFETKLSKVEQLGREHWGDLDDTAAIFDDLEKSVRKLVDFEVACLLLESETGGNIHFEDGNRQLYGHTRGGDPPWFDFVARLVRSRFRYDHFSEFGIGGITVRNVMKISNEITKTRFREESTKPEAVVHHLFFLAKSDENYEQAALRFIAGHDKYFPLSNSLGMFSVPALRYFIATNVGDAWENLSLRSKTTIPFPVARVLVCSVVVPENTEEENHTFAHPKDPYNLWLEHPPPSSGLASYRNEENGDGVLWRMHNSACVVPEYLVEFTYDLDKRQGYETVKWEHFDPKTYGIYSQLVHTAEILSQISIESEFEEVLQGEPKTLEFPTIDKLAFSNLINLVSINLGVKNSEVNLQALEILNLHGCQIRRFEPEILAPLENLHTLLLSFNKIELQSLLPRRKTVTTLDISFNLIQRLDSFDDFPKLNILDFGCNELSREDDVLSICSNLPELQRLTLRGNPVCNDKDTATRVLFLLRTHGVRYLDDALIPSKKEANEKSSSPIITDEVLLNASFKTINSSAGSTGHPWGLPEMPWLNTTMIAQPLAQSFNKKRSQPAVPDCWRVMVDYMELASLSISDPSFLTKFPFLRRLNLSSNKLTTLEHLFCLQQLEEINVERNLLKNLSGLQCAGTITRLDAGSNYITDVPELSNFSELRTLSLEDNYIESLDGFGALEGLVELYLSNNLIEDQRSVLMLKHLKGFQTLDLSGNQFRGVDYRLYAIFHLKLEVMDGVPVTQAKIEEARDMFSGKLTMEMLEEKFGPIVSYFNVRMVDLSNGKLREIGDLLNDETFPSLRELILDNNVLVNINSLGPLSKLLVLRLNGTKLDVSNLAGEDPESGIRSLIHLQVLELTQNGISDLSPLTAYSLTALRILHLGGNEIVRIEGLNHLEQLRELILDHNRIRLFDENSFKGLKSLRELHLEDNCLRTLTNLGPLPRLRALYLSLNRLSDMAELEILRDLRLLVQVGVANNPVARKPLYRAMLLRAQPMLRIIDDKEITDEEREKAGRQTYTDTQKPFGQPVYSCLSLGHPQSILEQEELIQKVPEVTGYADPESRVNPRLKVKSISLDAQTQSYTGGNSTARSRNNFVTERVGVPQRPASAGLTITQSPIGREQVDPKRNTSSGWRSAKSSGSSGGHSSGRHQGPHAPPPVLAKLDKSIRAPEDNTSWTAFFSAANGNSRSPIPMNAGGGLQGSTGASPNVKSIPLGPSQTNALVPRPPAKDRPMHPRRSGAIRDPARNWRGNQLPTSIPRRQVRGSFREQNLFRILTKNWNDEMRRRLEKVL